VTGKLQGSSIQISFFLIGIAGFACAAITFGYYGKPTPTDAGLWFFYLLCIASFFLGHLFFLRTWVNSLPYNSVEDILKSVLGFAVPVGLVLLPQTLGISQQLPPNTLVAYQIAKSYIITLYVLGSFNLYMKLLMLRHDSNKFKFIEVFYALLVLAALYLLVRQYMHQYITFTFYVVGGVGVAYLTTRLSWISLVRKQHKAQLALMLLLINAINGLLLYHYATDRAALLFSVYELPEIIFISVIGFSTVYALMALMALLFYFPVAEIVDQQTQELEGLMEISESARRRESVNQVFDRMFNASIRDTNSYAGWLWFKADEQDAIIKTKNINLSQVNSFRDALVPIVYNDTNKDVLNVPVLLDFPALASMCNGFRSMLALPIVFNEEELGMLCLFKNQEQGFDNHMTNMAKTYVNFALNAYENHQVLEETLRNEHVLEEYKLARQIQQRLIPVTLAGQNGWEAITYLEPSKEVGGDFYDSFVLDENRTALVIGDVSGRGMPAALHMAEIKGIFQSLTAFNLEPKELIARANVAISACFDKNRFVTLIYLVIDKKERKFTYVRAGHCPVLYYENRRHEANYIKDEGLGLGILRSSIFTSHVHVYERPYQQNDLLVLFSDGIDEAVDPKTKDAYGYERLKTSLEEASRHENLDKVMKSMLADIKRHIKENRELDDMTMILLRFD
jgi:serine phosphatase RsbU (regulator of sigma subunit)